MIGRDGNTQKITLLAIAIVVLTATVGCSRYGRIERLIRDGKFDSAEREIDRRLASNESIELRRLLFAVERQRVLRDPDAWLPWRRTSILIWQIASHADATSEDIRELIAFLLASGSFDVASLMIAWARDLPNVSEGDEAALKELLDLALLQRRGSLRRWERIAQEAGREDECDRLIAAIEVYRLTGEPVRALEFRQRYIERCVEGFGVSSRIYISGALLSLGSSPARETLKQSRLALAEAMTAVDTTASQDARDAFNLVKYLEFRERVKP